MNNDTLVYGESAHEILAALTEMNVEVADDGMHHFDGYLTPGQAGPFIRALLRAEAGLLIDDAASFVGDENLRTPDHRRADAFFEVVTEAGDALGLRFRSSDERPPTE